MWKLVFVVLVLFVAVVAAIFALRRPRPGVASANGKPEMNAKIDAFWVWWLSVSTDIARDISEGRVSVWTEEISNHVNAVEPGLAWELGPGVRSEHHLCVSSEGDPALRVLAEHWVSRAPPADETWEYYPARQAASNAKLTLRFDGGEAELGFEGYRLEYEVDADRELIHVKVHHPKMRELPESQRGLATFLFLDNALGEDGVERWLGGIETSVEPVPNAKTTEEFLAAVEELRVNATGDRFAILESTSPDGRRIVATVNLALKRIDHLLMDTHFEIHVVVDNPTPEGFHQPEDADELNQAEDELLDELGEDAVYIGRESGRGERVIHLHGAAMGPCEPRIRQWISQRRELNASLEVRSDPRWEILSRWR